MADYEGGAVGKIPLLKALAWSEYLESHAQRAYASVMQGTSDGAKALLWRIQHGDVPNPFTPRDIYLKHWANISNTEEVHEAVQLLCDLDYLKVEQSSTNGRPKTQFWINPKGVAQ